jgi:hypothetical protein
MTEYVCEVLCGVVVKNFVVEITDEEIVINRLLEVKENLLAKALRKQLKAFGGTANFFWDYKHNSSPFFVRTIHKRQGDDLNMIKYYTNYDNYEPPNYDN